MGAASLPQREKKRYAAAAASRAMSKANESTKVEPMQAVILAGGLATRLGARTQTLPKALLPIAGRPFLAWQLDALRSSGFSEVLLCISHLGDQIRDFLGDG